jgi:hypothetical protein
MEAREYVLVLMIACTKPARLRLRPGTAGIAEPDRNRNKLRPRRIDGPLFQYFLEQSPSVLQPVGATGFEPMPSRPPVWKQIGVTLG